MKILISDVLLMNCIPRMDTVIVSDSSEYGIWAVLLYKYKDGNMKPVVHASSSLVSSEKNLVR